MTIPERTIERLCAYRRILFRWRSQGKKDFHSHELAEEAGITPAQVRRDMMPLRTAGTPKKGYLTENLIEELGLIIEGQGGQKVVLVGMGNLGSAIVSYLDGMRPDLSIVAAFETNPSKIGKMFDYVPCLSLDDLDRTVREKGVLVAIVAVPSLVAQEIATRLVKAGVHALLNFSSIKLKTPPDVYVQDVDISIFLEKSAYFARVLSADPAGMQEDKKRVLCIIDDNRARENCRNLLIQSGFDVDMAASSADGMQLALSNPPDLIVIDNHQGSPVAGKFRKEASLRFTPILMLAPAGQTQEDPQLPIDGHVDEPGDSAQLLSAIRKLLNLPKNQINVEGGVTVSHLPSRSFAA